MRQLKSAQKIKNFVL